MVVFYFNESNIDFSLLLILIFRKNINPLILNHYAKLNEHNLKVTSFQNAYANPDSV